MNEKWSIVPVGGIEKIPTFVALLGSHLDLTVLVDTVSTNNQRLADMVARGLLKEDRLINVSSVLKTRTKADIEDLFEVEEYLSLYNGAFKEQLDKTIIKTNEPIVKQIEKHIGHSFHHAAPATQLLRTKPEFLEKVSTSTLDRFEQLIKSINSTLPNE